MTEDEKAKLLKELNARIKLLGSYHYLKGIERLARSMLYLPASAFDAKPDLLALENGTLDFGQGMFREHRATDYLTYKSPIVYDPEARCPSWDAFLEYFMDGDKDLIAYLARAVGYCLTGRVHEDVLFFCYGKGANGKSTFFGALRILLGDLMTTVPIAALLADKSDHNYDYHKASMEGKRIVVTDEIPEGRRLAEHQIKGLVGGDNIAARRPYEKPYQFKPTHKLWLVGNHKPEIRGTDYGIWRRIHLIPWTVTISEDKKRPRHEVLADFSRERAGILNWAIRGFLDMQALGGLKPPLSVVKATSEYRSDSDQFRQFFNQHMTLKPEAKTKLKTILAVYKKWCEENGEPSYYGSSKKISLYFREEGFEIKAIGHDKLSCVFGVALREEDPALAL